MLENRSEDPTIDDLKQLLNQAFPFIRNVSEKEVVQNEVEENFKKIVKNLSLALSTFIESNRNEDIASLEALVKAELDNGSIFDKKSLKYAVEDLIGNKLHLDIKTSTNTEFKISLIEDYKTLSRYITTILVEQAQDTVEPPLPSTPTDLLLRQVDEWLQEGKHEKIENLYKKTLKSNFSVEHLTHYIFYLLKRKNYDESEKAILQLLQADENFAAGFYLLAFLKTRSGDIEAAVLALKIAAKLQDSAEISVLLVMLCEKLEDAKGVQHLEMQLGIKPPKSEDVENENSSVQQTVEATELEVSGDRVAAIYDQILSALERQINFGLEKFVELTEAFIMTRTFDFRKPSVEQKLKIMEMARENIDDALDAMKSMMKVDENEISFKSLKGDLLYKKGDTQNAVKEYEVVFNLCLDARQDVSQHVSLRCGEWFSSIKNFMKAQRYFHYCCEKYATFKSWMGLGLICYKNGKFIEAESYFAEANKIDNKSGDNWICLALVNEKLKHSSKFRACFEIASRFDFENTDLKDEADKIFFSD